jgi:hypothetical protein
MSTPALVTFLGGFGEASAEQLVDTARLHATHDALATWRSAVPGASAILATGVDPGDVPPGVTVDTDSGPYHFGRRLAGILESRSLASAVYLGGGSLPLLTGKELAEFARAAAGGLAVSNNGFSSDVVAFPATRAAIKAIEGVERDNGLARALEEGAGLRVEEIPRSPATQLDIDAPADVAVLALIAAEGMKPGPGPRLREYLQTVELPLERYRSLLPLFLDRQKQIVIAGRAGSGAWNYLERETACRVRLFSEERGMEADGRSDRGTVRSLLGYYIESAGMDRFFKVLAELGDGAVIDTRVLLAHHRSRASRQDRFLSDLGTPEPIADQFLRDFTRAALRCQVPVLLGGHSLVSGGLMALNELAWSLRDSGEL